MRSGKLDRTITIQRETETVADSGAVSKAWTPIATIRAELLQNATDETTTGFGEADTGLLAFRVRYRDDITSADRVVYRGQNFDIDSVSEIGRRRGLHLKVSAK